MHKSSPLIPLEGKWQTEMGAWFPGERVVLRGKDLFNELDHLSWMGLLLYGITGREFNDKQIQLFDGIWRICTSYPDPRLWNNRVAALAGTARSTAALGVSAGNAVSEATIYGGRPILGAIDFLYRAQSNLNSGGELEDFIYQELKKYRKIYGYGRPVVKKDERIEPLMHLAGELGFSNGNYINLAFEIENILSKWRMQMNIAAVSAGLAADQYLLTEQYYQYLVLCFSSGIVSCYRDSSLQKQGALFPQSCNRLHFKGNSKKKRWQLNK